MAAPEVAFDPYADPDDGKAVHRASTGSRSGKRPTDGPFGLSTLFASSPYAPGNARLAAGLKLPRIERPPTSEGPPPTAAGGLSRPGSNGSADENVSENVLSDKGRADSSRCDAEGGRLLSASGGFRPRRAAAVSAERSGSSGGGGALTARTLTRSVGGAPADRGDRADSAHTRPSRCRVNGSGARSARGAGERPGGVGGTARSSSRRSRYAAHSARNLRHIVELAEARERRREQEEEATRREEEAAAKLASRVLKQAKAEQQARRQRSEEAAAARAAEVAEERRRDEEASQRRASEEKERRAMRSRHRREEKKATPRDDSSPDGGDGGVTPREESKAFGALPRRRHSTGDSPTEPRAPPRSDAPTSSPRPSSRPPSLAERAAEALRSDGADGDASQAGRAATSVAASERNKREQKFQSSYSAYIGMLTRQNRNAAEAQAEARQRVEEVKAKLARWVLKKAEKHRARRQSQPNAEPSAAASAPASPSRPSSKTSAPAAKKKKQERRGQNAGWDDRVHNLSASWSGSLAGLGRAEPGSANEDMERRLWRHKNRVPPGAKIFTMTGSYHDVRESLLRRGWYENAEPGSRCFDLKWCLKAVDIHETVLESHQIVNHFSKAAAITTKCGLGRSLQNCSWLANCDAADFFPRSHELFDAATIADWEADFKWSAAAAVLKRVIAEGGFVSVEREVAEIALRVCQAQLAHVQDMIEVDYPDHAPALPDLTEEEWTTLLDSRCYASRLPEDGGDRSWRAQPAGSAVECLNPEVGELEGSEGTAEGRGEANGDEDACEAVRDDASCEVIGEADVETAGERGGSDDAGEAASARKASSSFMSAVRRVVTELAQRVPQWNMDGCHNVWIVKPAGKSRGRGIQCFNNHKDIVRYTQIREAVAEDRYIVQKYIETALIVKRRKFDIRQWVLVTDWNPLTIYFYDTCYVRFCASDYSLEDLSVYSHLSNNSIAKHSDEFKSRDVSDGNMWHLHDFKAHLAETRGAKGAAAWEERIKPAMVRAVVASIKCAVDMIENRKNSFDVYGFDFVLDDDLTVWLLEINASPSMEHSTPVTAQLCAQVIDDTIKVVVDVPEKIKQNESAARNACDDAGAARGADAENYDSPTAAEGNATASESSDAGARVAVSDESARSDGPGVGAMVGHGKAHDGLDHGGWELVCRDASFVPQPGYCGLELTVLGSGLKPALGGKRKKKKKKEQQRS